MKEIILSNGESAMVDDEDYDKVSQFKWYKHPQGYAKSHLPSTEKRVYKKILMHQLLLKVPKGTMVDHINHNKLDNRKENLRVSTMSQNKANCPPPKTNTSGYKGVSFYKRKKKYAATIKVNYKRIFLGYFIDPKDAATAYDQAAIKYFGEYAYLNNA